MDFNSLIDRNLYTDLLRSFSKNGHKLCVISAIERRQNTRSYLIKENETRILKLSIGNIQKTNVIEKGLSTLAIERLFISGIKRYFSDTRFDLILYSTPPITFSKAINFVKKRDNAKSYLLLKDIFPQNAVDIGLLKTSGITSFIYKFFRKKEISLYRLSDKIGCMSKANAEYLLKHNSYINPQKINVTPNCIEVKQTACDYKQKTEIYKKYNIPEVATTFIYGGNLGRPQNIPFIIDCLMANENKPDRYFIICGTGTEYSKLKLYVEKCKPKNVLLINGLPRTEYEKFLGAFDVGLIFLDHRFTIPNFPSRLLSYMQAKMPVLACTDANTDIGRVITKGNFGWWCESGKKENFTNTVDKAISCNLKELGENAYSYLCNNYTADRCYEIICKSLL